MHGGDRKHIKVCKKKSTDELFFTPMPFQLPIHVSQNRPVRLVPCFVGVLNKHSLCFVLHAYNTNHKNIADKVYFQTHQQVYDGIK